MGGDLDAGVGALWWQHDGGGRVGEPPLCQDIGLTKEVCRELGIERLVPACMAAMGRGREGRQHCGRQHDHREHDQQGRAAPTVCRSGIDHGRTTRVTTLSPDRSSSLYASGGRFPRRSGSALDRFDVERIDRAEQRADFGRPDRSLAIVKCLRLTHEAAGARLELEANLEASDRAVRRGHGCTQ